MVNYYFGTSECFATENMTDIPDMEACSESSQCLSGVCKGGYCCGSTGISDGCTACGPYYPSCMRCQEGYTKKNYECFNLSDPSVYYSWSNNENATEMQVSIEKDIMVLYIMRNPMLTKLPNNPWPENLKYMVIYKNGLTELPEQPWPEKMHYLYMNDNQLRKLPDYPWYVPAFDCYPLVECPLRTGAAVPGTVPGIRLLHSEVMYLVRTTFFW